MSTTTEAKPDRADFSLGHKPEIRPVALNLLVVDVRVQRVTDPKRVAKIAAEFNIDAFGVPAVSKRKTGEYHVIDGGHRTAALRLLGFTNDEFDCEVYTDLTFAEEAAMFRLRNNTEAARFIDRFRVRVVEGEPTAMALMDLLDRYGWKVNNQNADGAFAAVQRLERIFLLNPTAAERAVATATKAWGHDRTTSDGRLIEGLGLLYNRYGNAVDAAELIDRLSKFPGGPGALLGKARGLRDMIGGTVPKCVAEVIVETYNARRKTRGLPGWRTS